MQSITDVMKIVNYPTLKRAVIGNWLQWLPTLCVLFFLALVLYSSWQIINDWFFSSRQTSTSTQIVSEDRGAAETRVPITAVPQWHIFGLAPNENADSNELPSTTLRLQLMGIMQASDANYSQVIIAGSDGKAEIYQVGANLPGGAKIKQILPYSVILERNGIQEKLDLPRKTLEISAPPKSLF
jgi:type II secretion system protein C